MSTILLVTSMLKTSYGDITDYPGLSLAEITGSYAFTQIIHQDLNKGRERYERKYRGECTKYTRWL